jgi:hypothetical protein
VQIKLATRPKELSNVSYESPKGVRHSTLDFGQPITLASTHTHNGMQYTSSIPIAGPPETAIRVVRDALIANGFTIVEAKPTEFTATGPGMMSTNQNAILGVSKATLRIDGAVIHVKAELGGAAWIGRFAMFFPIGLGVLLAAVFWVIRQAQGNLANKPTAVLAPLLAVSPWLVIGPLMARFIRKRTEQAVDALLQSAASISRAG